MVSMSNRTHLFARPDRRDELVRCFGTVLGCGDPVSIPLPGIAEPVLGFRFPGGGAVSIEFADDAPDSDEPGRGAWLELRSEDAEALRARILAAGLPEVKHAGHDFYFMAPGGQVFSVEAA